MTTSLTSQSIVRLLKHKPAHDRITASPYFAGIITGSLIWVFYTWATRLVRGAPGHLFSQVVFFFSFVGCATSFYKAITTDPGYVPKPENDGETKEAIELLTDEGRLNGTNFCIFCMVRGGVELAAMAPINTLRFANPFGRSTAGHATAALGGSTTTARGSGTVVRWVAPHADNADNPSWVQ